MKVTFTTKGSGTLTWTSPSELDRALRAAGGSPSEQAKALHDLMGRTAEILAALLLAFSYGAPGTPMQQVAFLEELDADMRRLVQNYLNLYGGKS